VDPAPPANATVWRNEAGSEWTQIVLDGMPASSLITGIVSGRAIGKPDQLVGSARTLTPTSDAFAVVSEDCGRSWQRVDLPQGIGPGFEYSAAVTASPEGFAIAGSVDGPTEGRVIALWRSADGFTWTLSSQPVAVVRDLALRSIAVDGSTVLIASLSDNLLHTWDGQSGRSFTPEVISRARGELLGSTASSVGVLTMEVEGIERKLRLGRHSAGALTVDPVPRIKATKYSVMTFLGDGGTRAWVVGQRDGTGKLETWSLTLPNTASEP
jgi:WD40 repeat protein